MKKTILLCVFMVIASFMFAENLTENNTDQLKFWLIMFCSCHAHLFGREAVCYGYSF
jgi:hypothetical protein